MNWPWMGRWNVLIQITLIHNYFIDEFLNTYKVVLTLFNFLMNEFLSDMAKL